MKTAPLQPTMMMKSPCNITCVQNVCCLESATHALQTYIAGRFQRFCAANVHVQQLAAVCHGNICKSHYILVQVKSFGCGAFWTSTMPLPSSKESGLCTAVVLTAFPLTWAHALLLTTSTGSASMCPRTAQSSSCITNKQSLWHSCWEGSQNPMHMLFCFSASRSSAYSIYEVHSCIVKQLITGQQLKGKSISSSSCWLPDWKISEPRSAGNSSQQIDRSSLWESQAVMHATA